MKWTFYLLALCALLSFQIAYSQVNPQNGAAQFNIPLYNYSDAGNNLGLNASLLYINGNGLKVSEMASAVGTGWILDCGGVITRTQHGEPDDQKQNGTFDYINGYLLYMLNYYPNGYLNSDPQYTPSDVIDNGGGYSTYEQYLPANLPLHNPPSYYRMPPQYLVDRDQDVFSFSFNGRKGEFMIGKNRQIKTLNDSKLKISALETDMTSSGIRTTISQFTVTDESGIQYIFKDMELDYVCTYNDFRQITSDNANVTNTTSLYLPATTDNAVNVVLGRPNGQYTVNKWYLSQIINPFTEKQIAFNYDTYEEDKDCDELLDYPQLSGHGTLTIYWQKFKAKAKRLSSVVLSNAERIDFIYSTSPRIDLSNQNALSSLRVTYNNSIAYSWNFDYGYFVGVEQVIKKPTDTYTPTEKQWARLCLLSTQKTGLNNSSEPPYQFTYNMGGDNPGSHGFDVIPPMFSLYQDHFGYYNAGQFPFAIPEGSATSFYSIANLKMFVVNHGLATDGTGISKYKTPLSTVAKNGILKSITYPLGGTLSFTYEANSTSQMQLGGVRVKTTTQYDGSSHDNDIVKQYNYTNADGSSSGWGGETYTYNIQKTLTAINCGGNTTPAYAMQDFASNYIQDGFMTGGFGFSSSAALGSALGEALTSMVVGVIVSEIVSNLFTSSYQDFQIQEYRNVSTVAHNPLPWGYARTEVVSMLSTDNIGKKVYEFSNPTSPEDHQIEIPLPNVRYSNRPRYAPWVYGLPKTITILDKTGNIVKQTINHYNYIVNSVADNNFLSKSWTAIEQEYGCGRIIPSRPNQNGIGTDFIQQETYYPLTGRAELSSVDESLYNTAQQHNTVTTSYEYDDNFQLKHKYFYNSKGEMIETFYYHPYDYTAALGAINTMNTGNSNIFSPVLSAETYIHKSDNNVYLIGATTTDFDVFSNGGIKPKVTYMFQSALPLLKTSLQPFNTLDVQRDPTYYKQVALYDYDNNGNLVQTITGGNSVTSNIYDYDGKLLVAAVLNASYSDIGYSSFEAQGGKPGSWLNMTAIVGSEARTGNNCFNLSDPSNAVNGYFGFSGLNGGLAYIVSFWSKNGTPCVNGSRVGVSTVNTCQGGSAWKQGVTVNGWTYYEVQVSNFDKISLSGSGLVDEFRVYPIGAQMTTTTYAPLIGKTSECDASGRVKYYLYDDLGRLVKISDDKRNVIRTYEYNYKQ